VPKFTQDGTLLIAEFGQVHSTKLAGFNPLVKTKSGNKIPKNASDWVWWNDRVPAELKKLHKDGFRIVVFTNQFVIADKPDKIAEVKAKFIQIQEAADVPITFLAALGPGTDKYRKPSGAMFDYLEKHLNGGKKFTKKYSFFCGVHAGRFEQGKLAKDCYDIDINFAKTIDLKFYTPDLYFDGKDDRLDILLK
jgi:bifunctional polynucleotide phosphatase/kinase